MFQDDDEVRTKNCLEKLTWRSKEEAEAAIAYAAWQYGEGGSRPKAYRCKYCEKWHLARRLDD